MTAPGPRGEAAGGRRKTGAERAVPPAARTAVTVARALDLARRGWPVFPCRPGGKEPATRHGFLDATTDPEQIAWWWRRCPDANLAVATGAPGPDVLDVDQHGPAGNGLAAYHRLRGAGLLSGTRAIVATPGGGLHAYFAGSGQPSGRLAGHHLDFKARGGYVLVPPSVVNGRRYRVLARYRERPGGLDWRAAVALLEPQPARPAGLARPGFRPRPGRPGDLARLVAWVEQLGEGNRNSGLFWAACRAVEAGQPALLDDLAPAAAKTGLTEREITRTLASAARAGQPGRQAEGEASR